MSTILKKSATGLGVVGVISLGVVAAVIVSLSAGAASAETGTKSDETQWIAPEAAPEIFNRSVETFTEPLPDGISWPEALSPDLLEEDVRMEKEVPLAVTSFYWLCAWEDTYLQQLGAGDVEASKASLETIDSFVDMPFYKNHFDDPEMVWYNAVIGAAKAGDPSGIQSNLDGCHYYWANQPS